MKTLCEVRVVKEGTEDKENPVYENRRFMLWHFGLKYQMIDMGDKKMIPINYTVAICEDCKTGQIRCFMPEELTIIGEKIQK
jgi:hypothetical protein